MIEVTSRIVSPIMKEYLSSSSKSLSVEDWCSIIVLNDNTNLETKINQLKCLKNNYPNNNIIEILIDIFELSYEIIYNPPKNNNYILFVSRWVFTGNDNYSNFNNCHDEILGAYNNFEQLNLEITKFIDDNEIIEIAIYDVSIKNNFQYSFRYLAKKINGKFEIIAPIVESYKIEIWPKQQKYDYLNLDKYRLKYDEDDLWKSDSILNGRWRHIAFPFEKDELVKFQTPYMYNPIFGYIISEYDKNNTMYCFFQSHYNIENCDQVIDFSYSLIRFDQLAPYFNYVFKASDDEIKLNSLTLRKDWL